MPGIREESSGLAYAGLEVVANAARIRMIRPPREIASDDDETGRRIMPSPGTPDPEAVKLYRETIEESVVTLPSSSPFGSVYREAIYYDGIGPLLRPSPPSAGR
jgi:hypothetical protein